MIKVLVPNMPTADQILPYLRRIDAAKWYTNFGALVCELEERLRNHYASTINGAPYVVTASSCTSALEILFEMCAEMGMDAVTMTPFTFQATALAAHRAGLRVRFTDIDRDTWSNGSVAVFGLPGDGAIWVDAAAAFGEQTVVKGQTVAFSMHATKILPAGEGGYIVTRDRDEAEDFRSRTNFGFLKGSRTSKYGFGYGVARASGTNAKMSEYHAAIGLASLDAYNREPWLNLFDMYAHYLPPEVIQQKRPRGVYPIIGVLLPAPVHPVMEDMLRQGIETRRWYAPPLYNHPLFKDDPRKFPVCEDISARLIGLPWHIHLTEEDVRTVCEALTISIRRSMR